MNNKSIIPAMFCALLSTCALAGGLVIDIAPTPPTLASITSTPFSGNSAVVPVNVNISNLSVEIGDDPLDTTATQTVDVLLDLAAVTGGMPSIKNNAVNAAAAANANSDSLGNYLGYNLNAIIFDGTNALSDAEALIASVNYNAGTVDSTIDPLNMNITADDVTGVNRRLKRDQIAA